MQTYTYTFGKLKKSFVVLFLPTAIQMLISESNDGVHVSFMFHCYFKGSINRKQQAWAKNYFLLKQLLPEHCAITGDVNL